MTQFYFAYCGNKNVEVATFAKRPPLARLVTTHSYKAWLTTGAVASRWCLDSGAFEALSQGKKMDYERWAGVVGQCSPDEVFGLDVIGDPRATRANVERAWADGIKAIPTFHYGSPWEYLEWAARSAPKAALGGVARLHRGRRVPWLQECFRRTWPARFHGFGIADAAAMAVPFHTVDAATWFTTPLRAMGYRTYAQGELTQVSARRVPRSTMHKDAASNDLFGEVESFLRFEKAVRFRWRREMELLDQLPTEWFV